MDNLQFMIAQGSTPYVELELPFDMPEGAEAVVSIQQKNTVRLEYDLSDDELAIDGNDRSILGLSMTEHDTFVLAVGDAEIQVRVKTDDGVDTFKPIPGVIVPAYNKEVMTDA